MDGGAAASVPPPKPPFSLPLPDDHRVLSRGVSRGGGLGGGGGKGGEGSPKRPTLPAVAAHRLTLFGL